MAEIDDALYARLLEMNRVAEGKLAIGECKGAAAIYLEALKLLPQPIEELEAATWISGRAADAFYRDRQYAAALQELRRTMRLPGATANPFLWLRRGQAQYELGNMEDARQSLFRAYMLGGEEIFEYENPEYRQAIQDLS